MLIQLYFGNIEINALPFTGNYAHVTLKCPRRFIKPNLHALLSRDVVFPLIIIVLIHLFGEGVGEEGHCK